MLVLKYIVFASKIGPLSARQFRWRTDSDRWCIADGSIVVRDGMQFGLCFSHLIHVSSSTQEYSKVHMYSFVCDARP